MTTLPAPHALLANITTWIMTLGIGTNNISAPDVSPYHSSIFINSNLARVLLASYKLTGNKTHLAEGLRWCDSFVAAQVTATTHDGNATGGWWNTGYDELYVADTGTAVTALAVCQDLFPKNSYLDALLRFATFVQRGTRTVPRCTPMLPKNLQQGCAFESDGKNETSAGWVITSGKDAGALGDGYYQGMLNSQPYTIATATVGGAFYAEMAAVGRRAGLSTAQLQTFRAIATNATRWLAGLVNQSDGTIPYVITPPTSAPHAYQCISYTAEAFVDVSLRFGDGAVNGAEHLHLLARLNATVEYVLATQDGGSGALLPNGTAGEVQRAPRAVTLLQWFYLSQARRRAQAQQRVRRAQRAAVEASDDGEGESVSAIAPPDSRIATALAKYIGYLGTAEGAAASGLNTLALPTGFIGLAVADLIEPWVTFARP